MEKKKRKGKPRINPLVEFLVMMVTVFIGLPLIMGFGIFIDQAIDTLFTKQQLKLAWGTLSCLVCCMGPGFLVAIIVYPAYWYQQTFGIQDEAESKHKLKPDD